MTALFRGPPTMALKAQAKLCDEDLCQDSDGSPPSLPGPVVWSLAKFIGTFVISKSRAPRTYTSTYKCHITHRCCTLRSSSTYTCMRRNRRTWPQWVKDQDVRGCTAQRRSIHLYSSWLAFLATKWQRPNGRSKTGK